MGGLEYNQSLHSTQTTALGIVDCPVEETYSVQHKIQLTGYQNIFLQKQYSRFIYVHKYIYMHVFNVQCDPTIGSFRRKLKAYLFNKAFPHQFLNSLAVLTVLNLDRPWIFLFLHARCDYAPWSLPIWWRLSAIKVQLDQIDQIRAFGATLQPLSKYVFLNSTMLAM